MAHLNLIFAFFFVVTFFEAKAFTDFYSILHHEPPVDRKNVRFDHVTEHWITQKLDNFDPTDSRIFQMVKQRDQRKFIVLE